MTNNFEEEHSFISDKKFQREFVVDNFQLLAAIGWHSYLSSGKGFILISSSKGPDECHYWLIPSSLMDFVALYIGEKNQAFQTLFSGEWGDFNQVIKSYTPREVSLVAFHNRKTNQFSTFFVGTSEITPVNSYQVLAPRLGEFSFTL